MKGLIFFALILCTTCLFGQFAVDDSNYTVEELVNEVLVDSNCAETSNYSSFTGRSQNVNGIGYFNANGTDFPYEEGIVLSTGRAIDAEGPNININDSGYEDWPGDDELRAITGTGNLYNATYIQFDFVPLTNSISFNFLFASEEYQENYQCIYSDVFAFILTDSDGVSTNLAIVPNTNLPVSATTIRPGISGECSAQNMDFFDKINNDNSAISFHGQTKSLKAESMVNPGERYSIKLVISDNQDSQVDSAVFLEAGSFTLGLDLGEDRTINNGNPVCIGETVPIDAHVDGVQDYRWYKDTIEIPQWAGNAQVDLTEGGNYSVDLVFSDNCVSTGDLFVEFISPPEVMETPLDLTSCDVDGLGKGVFDFFSNERRILGNQDTSIYQVTYYSTEADAQAFTNSISNSNIYETNTLETIYARISSKNSCYKLTSFQLIIQDIDLDTSLEEQYALCLDSEGNSLEPLPTLNTGLSASEYGFTWYKGDITPENLISEANGPFYTASSVGVYQVVLQNLRFGCDITISTEVIFSQQPDVFEVVFVSDVFTKNNIIDIIAEGNGTYLYSVDDGPFGSANRFENLGPGDHIAAVTDLNGCSVLLKEFLVVDFPRFFTPNGDGVNDKWTIAGFSEFEKAEVSIFDRYGTLLYQFKDGSGWNGKANGNEVPSSDYWFRISYLKDDLAKEYKSHFTLKR